MMIEHHLQPQSEITISDEDLEEESIIFEICKCDAKDVHEQTTLKLDTPDLTQNLHNQTQNIQNESSPMNESGNLRLDTSCNPLNQSKVESSTKTQSGNLRITAQSTRNQDKNLVTERSPRDLRETQKPALGWSPFCFPRCVIPFARPRETSENLQPVLSHSARNQSTNLVYEHGSTDVSDSQKSASDQSQTRYDISEERPTDIQTDLNQSVRNPQKGPSDRRENEKSELNRYNIPEARTRKRSVSLQPDSGQSANIMYGHNSRIQSDKQKRISNQGQLEYNIPEKRPRVRSVSLQPDSDQSTNNQSKNIIFEHSSKDQIDDQSASNQRYPSRYPIPTSSPRDLLVKREQGQNSRNNRLNSLFEHTRSGNQRENPLEQSQRPPILERDQSQRKPEDQSKNDEEITKRSEIKDIICSGECLCKCHCQNSSYDPTAISNSQKYISLEDLITLSNSERDKEKSSSKSETIKEKSAEECQCKCFCQNTSYDQTKISDSRKYISSEHLLKETSRNPENDKEKYSSTSENANGNDVEECQCKCICEETTSKPESDTDISSSKSVNDKENIAEECQCKCICEETSKSESDKEKTTSKSENDAKECLYEEKTRTSECDKENDTSKPGYAKEKSAEEICAETISEKSTVSDNQRWIITPGEIMKGLEALKESFWGKSEDHTSIWINEAVNRSPSYFYENMQTETLSVSPNPCSETNHHRKSVSIQEPIRSNKCVYCDPDDSCEEQDSNGCASPKRDREVQKSEQCDRSQGPESMFFVEDTELKQTNTKPTEKTEPIQDSGGGSSCAGACEQYYRDKLLSTLQILENKEQTIRVQGSSLAVAEDRITELTKRSSELRQELERKARELNQIRQFADSRVDKSDVSCSSEIKDAEAQKHLVETLEDNLSTVIELYRECFYETAKQEELIDMLRKSYLDVRLMEKGKTEKIIRLQNVINTQKRSIEQCQDVVLEVESLKSEISSFLNSSNNDSGMWERGSESPDVSEELADILDQLRQLQQMLTSDCTCGLEEECTSLKERNRALEAELEKQTQRNNELDTTLKQILDQQYEKQMKEKERELEEVVKKLEAVEITCKERGETCETLTTQLQQAQVMLDDKTAELVEAQQSREAQDSTITRLQQDLDKSEQLVEEGLKKLTEVAHSRAELLLESQARISELEERLRHSARRCRELEAGCRERELCLEEAHARGAMLCDESWRVTAGVKQWMREKRQLAREQQEKIKLQKLRIRELERLVGARQNVPDLTSQSETDACCSNNTHEYRLTCETSYPRCSRLNPMCRSETTTFLRGPIGRVERERENETASCSKCASNRQESASEMASCSRAPVPPRRKKRQSCDDVNYRHASQAPRERFEPPGHSDVRWSRLYSRLHQTSPTDEVLERVEHLHAALAAGQRRWGRARR